MTSEKKVFNNVSGSCLCGDVAVTIQVASNEVTMCHCSQCRLWSNGPLLTIAGGESSNIRFHGDSVSVFKSSAAAERLFCSHCGTILCWRRQDSSDHDVNVELFPEIVACAHIGTELYCSSKPKYYALTPPDGSKTSKHDTMPSAVLLN
eukprot:Gregarina_sp_Pseudo_9__5031@NODE_528_length_2635_cov_45_493451_g434_i1_p3_GENE_NODE_528_length_2635_cov_45_493451_g434_i1NODE_528_length_2635_cov_45_493451_g434_i1_p3_ORF_typecomplete_len149_score21_18GFA/PF04828_14/5_7e13WD40_like/PF17005_5/0_0024Nudix_N_2/PF14803_6/1_2e04Nudix_N_2/PF14803_6/0_07YippeeMis18/PF03226_14/1_6e02YippeeMis18/PF03226_14/0_52DUF2769/PF10967_8/4_3e02DUF2769/PF10967_8/5_3DUF2769/PF10967_8/4_9e02DUF2769/PF10967_8/8_3e02_NODE_528_length_2635_cov_45_493451_g434_i17391185